jgi:hypothetical protein
VALPSTVLEAVLLDGPPFPAFAESLQVRSLFIGKIALTAHKFSIAIRKNP